MKTVAFHTLGCKLNFSETSAIARQFADKGFVRKKFTEFADIYVLNTCSVTDNADKKCRKAVRQALKINPEAYFIVVGCYAQLKPEEIASIPGVDLVLGAAEKFQLFEHVDAFTKSNAGKAIYCDIKAVEGFTSAYSLAERTRSFLKIQDGCDYKCTFCTIPLARGKSRSDSLANILNNAREIATQGVKEIVLTGVNIGDYGKDQPHNFLQVLQGLDQVEGIERIRISSIEPNLLKNEIIEYVAASKHIQPHFHMPLQSGNDELLGKMRRRYKRELYTNRVEQIKSLLPHACIGVDVIVGFPGESDLHFQDTYQYLNELPISYLHVFTYSERINTLAASMQNAVPLSKRQERSKMLRILSEKKRRAFYANHIGQARPVLFEGEVAHNMRFGFTDNYIKVAIPEDEFQHNEIQLCTLNKLMPEGFVAAEVINQPVHA